MRIKIINHLGHFVYANLTGESFSDAIYAAALGIATEGCCAKYLYFIVGKDADLPLEVVHQICSAVQVALSGSLVWDIVTELPQPLHAEDGVMAYLYISQ